MEEIAKSLSSSQIAHLDLRDCGLTASSIHSLADEIANSRTLKVLRLDENALEAEGAAALAGALNADSCLEDLQLSHTSIGDEGRLNSTPFSSPTRMLLIKALYIPTSPLPAFTTGCSST